MRVYVYLIGKGEPQGPRDLMRELNLSSPSVAYRNLEKLRNLGLVEKDSYGQYAVTEKVNIKGHLWIGKSLIPRLIFYAFFFTGILIAEITIIAFQVSTAQPLQLDFVFFTFTTAITLVIFLLEGMQLFKRVKII